jgi:hypothetical protein
VPDGTHTPAESADVDVRIDDARYHGTVTDLDHPPGIDGIDVLGDRLDTPVADADVPWAMNPVLRVDDSPASQYHIVAHRNLLNRLCSS